MERIWKSKKKNTETGTQIIGRQSKPLLISFFSSSFHVNYISNIELSLFIKNAEFFQLFQLVRDAIHHKGRYSKCFEIVFIDFGFHDGIVCIHACVICECCAHLTLNWVVECVNVCEQTAFANTRIILCLYMSISTWKS